MDSFTVDPAKVEDNNIEIVEGGVARHRIAAPLVVVESPADPVDALPAAPPPQPTVPPVSPPALPSVSPPVSPVAPPAAPAYRSAHRMRTQRWLCDASTGLVDALLSRKVPKETAALWRDVLDADLDSLADREAKRQELAVRALQVAIESSPPERAMELSSERDRCLASIGSDEVVEVARRCATAIDAAMNEASELRRSTRHDRREVESTARHLEGMCRPYSCSAWAPRILEVVHEEADAARRRMDAAQATSVVAVRAHKPSACADGPPRTYASNPHLQTALDATEAQKDLRAVRTVRDAAVRCAGLVASCPACEGPDAACTACAKA